MCTNDKNIWLDALDRTGFPLEYQTQQLLRNHGWNVINSRYYLDDKTGSEREVDIVAYKTRPAEGVLCCTYLMISCKKATGASLPQIAAAQRRISTPAPWGLPFQIQASAGSSTPKSPSRPNSCWKWNPIVESAVPRTKYSHSSRFTGRAIGQRMTSESLTPLSPQCSAIRPAICASLAQPYSGQLTRGKSS